MTMPEESPGVKIDAAHGALLAGLIRALKPRSVLELGYGGGGSATWIQSAIRDNGQVCTHTLVDNWRDWDGVRPEDSHKLSGIDFVEADEGEFTLSFSGSFDFIFSDADHARAQEWFGQTYYRLLNPGGILAYHDVCAFPNLAEIVDRCRECDLTHVVFNRNSLPQEACQRGLLVIFKSDV